MTYYKVTTTNLHSIAVSQNELAQDFVVKYEVDIWAYPNDKRTKLFVFKDCHCALGFAQDYNHEDYKIWECEVLNPTTEYDLFIGCVYSLDFIDRLKDVLEFGSNNSVPIRPPISTVFADAVKLTKLVKSSEEKVEPFSFDCSPYRN